MLELLQPGPVRKLLEDDRSGRKDNHKLLFSLITLEQWLRGIRSDRKRFMPEQAIEKTAQLSPA
jgi:asparagine synthase (glutamine-hydrolysing)